ncbi:MAG: hypothetical protein AVDCRST_MAG79-1552 [uncultured Thermoleophilia bacterium]|uniref:Uncharacterized protein n=1 Tax=uncultured Thermoleophilia bacterium TaxID=1497501 RepID=A0A6J4U1J5_9ACTN|nr:MAG: hypothetical protein AVDCRST_MAG79-1552 [uncultured Thermoleophilia bacterium]
MIAFGVWVESEERYARVAAPALARVLEADSAVLESVTDGCIFEAYAEIMDAAADLPGLEALVLLRDDVELLDADLTTRLRAALAEPGAALVGAVGARHVTSLRWWEGDVVGRLAHPGGVLGDAAAGPQEVHVLDGALLALAPAVVTALRYDRACWAGVHGHDAELCALTRAAGGRVLVTDLDVRRASAPIPAEDLAFLRADLLWRARWSALPDAA